MAQTLGMKNKKSQMTSIALFCISRRKVVPLFRNGELGEFQLHDALAHPSKLCDILQFPVSSYAILYLSLQIFSLPITLFYTPGD